MRRLCVTSLAVVAMATFTVGCAKTEGPSRAATAPTPTTEAVTAPETAPTSPLTAVIPGTSAATTPVASVPVGPATTKYEQAVDAANARHLEVWLEGDLAKRWQAGSASFKEGVQSLGRLAARPGVVGIKVADELGYKDGFDTHPDQVRAFLADTRRALSAAAPGKQILVDFVVPALGCAGSGKQACVKTAEARYPALALAQLDRLFSAKLIDVADISTSLLEDSQYRAGGTDRKKAQRAAWAEIARRRWAAGVRLHARKALAHAGRYEGTRAEAEADAALFVDIPLASGAAAVDIWSWRQTYKDEVVRLTDPGNAPNALWAALLQRRAGQAKLFTHFTPSSVELGLGQDLDVLAKSFTAVFLAAGIG